MKIEIRETKTEGMVQITVLDERFYMRQEDSKLFPSVTWICGSYPKGKQFWRWLAEKGWDEAEAIKSAAGDKGSKVHHAIEMLLKGNTVAMSDSFADSGGIVSELSGEEWECLMSFADWFTTTKPEILATEQVVYNEELAYAGTVDCICKIGEDVWLLDFKTGQSVWPEYELQLSAYAHADKIDVDKLGILQIGYRLNKRHWKLTEVEDKFPLFQAAQLIWQNEHGNEQPKKKDFPLTLTLNGVNHA